MYAESDASFPPDQKSARLWNFFTTHSGQFPKTCDLIGRGVAVDCHVPSMGSFVVGAGQKLLAEEGSPQMLTQEPHSFLQMGGRAGEVRVNSAERWLRDSPGMEGQPRGQSHPPVVTAGARRGLVTGRSQSLLTI